MLRTMRAPDGGPALRTRMVALLVALSLFGFSAGALIPVTRWIFKQLVF